MNSPLPRVKDFLPLALEVGDLLAPEIRRAPARREAGEPAVGLLPRAPRGVVDEAHRAQGLDQAQRLARERQERLVALEQELHLDPRRAQAVGQQQPEILHRGPDGHVVEVQQVVALARPVQDVAAVAVPVDPQRLHALEQRGDQLDQSVTVSSYDRARLRRQRAGLEDVFQVQARGVPRVQRDPVARQAARADRVHPGDQPAQLHPRVRVAARPAAGRRSWGTRQRPCGPARGATARSGRAAAARRAPPPPCSSARKSSSSCSAVLSSARAGRTWR